MRTQVIVIALATIGATAGQMSAQDEWGFDGPSFAAISVIDLDRSVEWFQTVFGMDVVRSAEVRDGLIRIALLQRGETVVELVAHREPLDLGEMHPNEPIFRFAGFFKSGLFVRGIDALHAYLAELNVVGDEGVMTDDAIGMRTFVFLDPDGNRLQAFERVTSDP